MTGALNDQLDNACEEYGISVDLRESVERRFARVIIELSKKVGQVKVDKPVEDALWQLEEKDYASIYSDSGKKIMEIGVVFSRENRNIIDWDIIGT